MPRLERALELDPTHTAALNNLGVYDLRKGRYPESEALLRRALAVNPARFNTWFNLGLAQFAQGKREETCASLARALAINPQYREAREAHTNRCTP